MNTAADKEAAALQTTTRESKLKVAAWLCGHGHRQNANGHDLF